MNFSWPETIKSLQKSWKNLNRSQKILSVTAPLVVAIALLSLIYWASRPQYVDLFTKLSAEEAGAITSKLKELKVEYQLADNGSTIKVPQKDAAEIRLELADEGLPAKSNFSFDYLNQTRLGETDADRQLRYILGLQNELEQTIETMDGVEYARVHIVLPERSLFAEEQKDTTAAVTIKRKYGAEIGENQVKAIANLLAHSVEGLTTENITIVDTNGNVLSDILGSVHGLTTNQLQYQKAVEDNIQKSLQSMLDKVFGPNNTIVRVNATLDFDQRTITSQTSTEGTVISRQETSETSSNTSTDGGVPGVDGNVVAPEYNFDDQNTNVSSSERTSLSETFQPSVTQEETIVSPGRIKRLTISVLADTDSVSQAQLDSIVGIVSSAAGVDETRGDVVEVAGMPFNKTAQLENQKAMEEAAKRQRLITYAQMGAGVLLAIIVLIVVLRLRSRKAAKVEDLDLPPEQKMVTLEEAEQILASQLEAERMAELKLARKKVKTPDEIEREKIREEVDKFSKENPDEVARLVKAWLAEDS